MLYVYGMAYRVLPNGVIETDTLAEAIAAQTAVTGKKPAKLHTARRADNDTLNGNAKQFLRALIAAPKTTLSTEQAAKALNFGPKSLPPVIRSLNNWCRKHRVTLDAMVKRDTAYEDRRVISVYRLTDEGRQFFQEKIAKSSREDDSGGAAATGTLKLSA
jgi:hypothetical protein